MNDTLTIIPQQAAPRNVQHGRTLNAGIAAGNCFNAFVEGQNITSESRSNLREETFDILRHCNPHDAVGNDETTHLVVGYVQSGKTMSFTALTALAHDNGYRVVVFLAGTKDNLLEQTTARLESDLVKNAKGRAPFKIYQDPQDDETEAIVGHLHPHLASRPTILIPIMKNRAQLDKVTRLFKSEDFIKAMKGETVLIIDDEADQASLNGYGRKNSQQQEDKATATYDSILKMRAALPGNTYVQYTATPQANILISMQDLLSPQSHTLLTPGEGYIGGKLFFGKGENGELYNRGLIKEITAGQVFHATRNNLRSMPPSLKEALMLHVLATAIVVFWNEATKFLSMMIHPDGRIANNAKFKRWVDSTLSKWRRDLDRPDGQEEKEDLLSDFKKLFPQAIQYYEEDERPTFDDIKSLLPDVLNDKRVYLVTSREAKKITIDWDKYAMHILVGGEMLNRGFTIENLATTYMPRHTAGATNADTIQQRCRFFGYKRKYIKSCRVYLPQISINHYLAYIDHEEELRATLATCDSLEAAERQILLSPTLRPTRANVLPVTVVETKLRGQRPLQAFESKATIERNRKVVSDFLDKHAGDFTKTYSYGTPDRTHRAFYMEVDEAIEFLTSFKFGNYPDASQKSATVRYLRYLSEKGILKHVHFVQMAYDSTPRERSFDYEERRLAGTVLFAGRSADGKKYPGDAAILAPDTITIQLHHIQFKPQQVGFPQTAYTLAINYPPALATTYRSNEGNNDEDDEEDEDE